MSKSITQDMRYRQSLMQYAAKYGVSRASRKYNKSWSYINRLLKPNYNKTVIVITHDFELAKKFDRIIGMKEGKIICDSPPHAFAWELFEKHNSDKRSLPQIG